MAGRWPARASPAYGCPSHRRGHLSPLGHLIAAENAFQRRSSAFPRHEALLAGQHPSPLGSTQGKLSLEIELLTSSLQASFVVFYTSLHTLASTAVSATTTILAVSVKTRKKTQPYCSET